MKRRMVLAAAGAAMAMPAWARASSSVYTDRFPLKRPARVILVTSGDYYRYQAILRETARELAELGVIEQGDVPIPDTSRSTWPMWKWLIKEAGGAKLQFMIDGWYDYGFDVEKRQERRQDIIDRLATVKDVDLIFTMGTDAALDMKEFVKDLPVINLSCSDPIVSGVVASADDAGQDNIHVLVTTDMWKWQLRRFHSLFRFKRLVEVAARRNIERSGIEDAQALANALGYEFVVKTYGASRAEEKTAYVLFRRALLEALDQDHCDAVYLPWFPANDDDMRDLNKLLTIRRIPAFSQIGSDAVRRGILLGVGEEDFAGMGEFEAKVVAQVLRGVKPRAINMRFQRSQSLVLNLKTAMDMGWQPPLGLLATVERTFETQSPELKQITLQPDQ